ncbi:hypothetical protein D3C78_754320 [compost metagenome]
MSRPLRITLYALAAILLLAITLTLYWVRDDSLHPEASAWVQAVDSPRDSSDGYLYLLGLVAATEPRAAGRARLAEYRQWRATHSPFDDSFQPAPLRQLDIPKLAAQHNEHGYCLEPARDEVHLEQGRELLKRYRQVARLADLRSPASELSEPQPNYVALLAGNRLLALDACRLRHDGQTEQARTLLEEDIGHWRRHLAAADTLIQKMVTVHLIAGDIGVLAALYQQGLIGRPAALPPLTAAERSLQSAMQSEFAMLAKGFASMRDDPHFLQEHGRLALQLLFKPNMSSNATLPDYQRIARASQLTASEFADWLRQSPPPRRQDWRNPIGNILVAVAIPDMSQYLAQLHDLDARIQLYNRLNTLAPGFSSAQALAQAAEGNPYGLGPARLVEGPPQRLCYDGPREDAKQLRCLALLSQDPAPVASHIRP